ncbi:TPA: hypothetical protein ACOEMH_004636, partial [Enterobacter hormaechei subsp. xiangfangensis]
HYLPHLNIYLYQTSTPTLLQWCSRFASKKAITDKNGTTPHPPAVFRSQKFFSWDFLQMIAPDPATTGDLQRAEN